MRTREVGSLSSSRPREGTSARSLMPYTPRSLKRINSLIKEYKAKRQKKNKTFLNPCVYLTAFFCAALYFCYILIFAWLYNVCIAR